MHEVFDFSRYDVEDVSLRLTDMDDPDRWVEVLVTPSGRRALLAFSEAVSPEEAIVWAKTAA